MKLCALVVVLASARASKIASGNGKQVSTQIQNPSDWLGVLQEDDAIPIDAIEAEVLALARAAKTKGAREADIQTFAKQLNNTIQNEMFGELRNRSRRDEQKLASGVEAVAACADFIWGAKVKKTLSEQEVEFDAKKDSHIKCRLAEQKLQQKVNTLKAQKDVRYTTFRTVCGAVDNKKNTQSKPLWQSQCQPNPLKTSSQQNPNVVWIESQAKYFKNQVDQWNAELEACEQAKEHLSTATKLYMDALNNKTSKKQKCDAFQTGSMDTQCSLRKSQRSSNTAYENCYEPALNTFEADTYQVKLNVRKRKLEWRTLERISCLILALVQSTVDLDAQINFCIRQLYDGHQMNLIYPTPPPKSVLVEVIIDPCTALTHRKLWAPSSIDKQFMIPCSACKLPPTVKPTPAPTPPPPPPKFRCGMKANQNVVHVKYGGFPQKISSGTGNALWNTPVIMQEWNETDELEVLVANAAYAPQLEMYCEYITGTFSSDQNKKKGIGRWNFCSSCEEGRPVLAAYGKTHDEVLTARLEWPRKFKKFDFPSQPSSKPWGDPGFARFVASPYCNVDCLMKADDEIVLLMYNGRYVPLKSPRENNANKIDAGQQSTRTYLGWNTLRKFCFKFEKDAKLIVEVRNIGGPAGLVLKCTSKITAWNQYTTNQYRTYTMTYKAGVTSQWLNYDVTKSGYPKQTNVNQESSRIGNLKMWWPRINDATYKFVTFSFAGNS